MLPLSNLNHPRPLTEGIGRQKSSQAVSHLLKRGAVHVEGRFPGPVPGALDRSSSLQQPVELSVNVIAVALLVYLVR